MRPDCQSWTWTTGDQEVSESQEEVASHDVEKIEDTEGESKAQTRVTYNIVFVTSEAAPYSKTGGLGDVCGSLPIALAAHGHRVMVVSPRYQNGTEADQKFANAIDLGRCIKVYCFEGEQEVSFFHEYREGVDWVRISLVSCLSWAFMITFFFFREKTFYFPFL